VSSARSRASSDALCAPRDYFRVEDRAGLRFWLFRAGLYRDMARGLSAPSWFLHGMYA
jgi:protein ImuB